MQTVFPPPLDEDSEDVSWGLTTGAALWKQGEQHDALIWLKRAVVAATEAGQSRRADQLNRAATRLIAALAAPEPVHSSVPPLPFGPSSSGRIQVLKPLPTSHPPSGNHRTAAQPPPNRNGES